MRPPRAEGTVGTLLGGHQLSHSNPVWRAWNEAPELTSQGLFSLCLVLEFGSDGSWVALTRYPFRNTVIAPISGNAAMILSFKPSLENPLAEENVQDQTVSNN